MFLTFSSREIVKLERFCRLVISVQAVVPQGPTMPESVLTNRGTLPV